MCFLCSIKDVGLPSWQLLAFSNTPDSHQKCSLMGSPHSSYCLALFRLDCHNAGAILFMVFPPVPGNRSIHNEFSSYGHILISLSASILNSPQSPEVCNVVEEL